LLGENDSASSQARAVVEFLKSMPSVFKLVCCFEFYTRSHISNFEVFFVIAKISFLKPTVILNAGVS
jgi:hypothetical protein